MARYTVEKGLRYKAKISLGLLQSVASNDMVAGAAVRGRLYRCHCGRLGPCADGRGALAAREHLGGDPQRDHQH